MRTEALNNLAVLEMRTGDEPRAIRYFRELLALNQDDVHALYNLASLLLDTSASKAAGFPEAERHITRLEKLLTPSHPRVQVLKTAAAIRSGRYPAALALLRLQGREGLESALFQGLWAELAAAADDEIFAAAVRFLTSQKVSPGVYFLKMEQLLLSRNMVREALSLRQRSAGL